MPDWLRKKLRERNLLNTTSKSPIKDAPPIVSSPQKTTESLASEMFALLSSKVDAGLEEEKRSAISDSIGVILNTKNQSSITSSLSKKISALTEESELQTLIENYSILATLSKANSSLSIPTILARKEYLSDILKQHPLLQGVGGNATLDFYSRFIIKGTEVPKESYSFATSYLQYTPHKPKTLEPLNYFVHKTPLVSTEGLKSLKDFAPPIKDLDSSLATETPYIIPNPQKIIDILSGQGNLDDLKQEIVNLIQTPRISTLDKEDPTYKFLLQMESHIENANKIKTPIQDFISTYHRQITSLLDIAITNMPNRPVPQELVDQINQHSIIPHKELVGKKSEALSEEEQISMVVRIQALQSAHQHIKGTIEAFGLDKQGYKISDVADNDWTYKKPFTEDDVRIPYISRRTQDLMHFVLFDWEKDVLHANSETVGGAKLKQLLLYFKDSADKFPENLPLLQEILKDKLSKIISLDEQPYHPPKKGEEIDTPFTDKTGKFSPEKLREFIDKLYEGETSVTIELWSLCPTDKEKPYFDAWNKQKLLLKKLKDGDNSVTDKMEIGQAYIFPIYTKLSANVINGSENNLEHYNQIIAERKSADTVDITYINPLTDKNYSATIPNSVFQIVLGNMVHADVANPSPEADFLKNQNSFFKKLEELSKTDIRPKETPAEKQIGLQCSTHSIRRGIEVVTG